ncbi:hypothetical protein [Fischerella thermalis]|uniref:hypothetical protein n=1 Tax=Fischerella thermalis TaxID=372787 RepID=UPI0011AF4E06
MLNHLLVVSLRFLLLAIARCLELKVKSDRSEFRIRDRSNYSWVGVINNKDYTDCNTTDGCSGSPLIPATPQLGNIKTVHKHQYLPNC